MIAVLLSVLLAVDAEPCHVHERTDIEFGPPPPDYRCAGPRDLDPARQEITMAYGSTTPGAPLTATVYLYQKLPPCSSPDEPIDQHLAAVREEVGRRYEHLECERWHVPDRPALSGLRCQGRSKELGPGEYETFIGLEEHSGWWLKIRATANANGDGSRIGEVQALLATIRPKAGPEPSPAPESPR